MFTCVKGVTETTKVALTLGLRQSYCNVCDDDEGGGWIEGYDHFLLVQAVSYTTIRKKHIYKANTIEWENE